jgi:hypothetical protein
MSLDRIIIVEKDHVTTTTNTVLYKQKLQQQQQQQQEQDLPPLKVAPCVTISMTIQQQHGPIQHPVVVQEQPRRLL